MCIRSATTRVRPNCQPFHLWLEPFPEHAKALADYTLPFHHFVPYVIDLNFPDNIAVTAGNVQTELTLSVRLGVGNEGNEGRVHIWTELDERQERLNYLSEETAPVNGPAIESSFPG